MSDLTFVLSDTLADEASSAFALHRDRVLEHLPDAEVFHVGGTSLPGLLTTGDVDIVVRVEAETFDRARDVMSELYPDLHPDSWTSEAAFFRVLDEELHVEFALTASGSLVDFHHAEAWRLMASDPALIAEYNAIKRAHEGGSIDAYLSAKRSFFRENFAKT